MVDDVAEVLSAFERLLGSRYAVETAESGEEAIGMCTLHGPYAVVVADYEMPGMRGSELLMRIREHWPETVAILLTGVVDVDVAIDALHNGRIFRFLEKPCAQAQLVSAIEDALEEHRRLADAKVAASSLRFSRDALSHFNGALSRRVAEQSDALMRLNRFVCELNGAESLDEIVQRAAEAAHELLDSRAIEVHLRSAPGGRVEHRSSIGRLAAQHSHREPASTADGEVGWIDADVLDREGRPLNGLQVSMLASIATSTAIAAHNQMRRRERDDAQHATILALAKLAEQRDNETGKHVERVSLYCTLVAEGLREDGWYRDVITDDYVRDLYRSAPLHDIGKVGIPDAILLKPGKLTPEEWVVMRTHTTIGAETLRAVMEHNSTQSFLRMSMDIAWCHHEFWDGRGYPRGLSGEDIPLAARILALADVYDALTSVRVYKSAWKHADALASIRAESGTHFDPRCVESFLKREQQADRIRGRLADTREDVLAQLRLGDVRQPAA